MGFAQPLCSDATTAFSAPALQIFRTLFANGFTLRAYFRRHDHCPAMDCGIHHPPCRLRHIDELSAQ
jgi:hypothetical protein